MAQLTWQNINADGLNGAVANAQNASNTMYSRVGDLVKAGQGLLGDIQQGIKDQWEFEREENTQEVINRMHRANSIEEMNAIRDSIASGSLRNQFGNKVDLSKINQVQASWIDDVNTRASKLNESKDWSDAAIQLKGQIDSLIIAGKADEARKLLSENAGMLSNKTANDLMATIINKYHSDREHGLDIRRVLATENQTNANIEQIKANTNQTNAKTQQIQQEIHNARIEAEQKTLEEKRKWNESLLVNQEEFYKDLQLQGGTLEQLLGTARNDPQLKSVVMALDKDDVQLAQTILETVLKDNEDAYTKGSSLLQDYKQLNTNIDNLHKHYEAQLAKYRITGTGIFSDDELNNAILKAQQYSKNAISKYFPKTAEDTVQSEAEQIKNTVTNTNEQTSSNKADLNEKVAQAEQQKQVQNQEVNQTSSPNIREGDDVQSELRQHSSVSGSEDITTKANQVDNSQNGNGAENSSIKDTSSSYSSGKIKYTPPSYLSETEKSELEALNDEREQAIRNRDALKVAETTKQMADLTMQYEKGASQLYDDRSIGYYKGRLEKQREEDLKRVNDINVYNAENENVAVEDQALLDELAKDPANALNSVKKQRTKFNAEVLKGNVPLEEQKQADKRFNLLERSVKNLDQAILLGRMYAGDPKISNEKAIEAYNKMVLETAEQNVIANEAFHMQQQWGIQDDDTLKLLANTIGSSNVKLQMSSEGYPIIYAKSEEGRFVGDFDAVADYVTYKFPDLDDSKQNSVKGKDITDSEGTWWDNVDTKDLLETAQVIDGIEDNIVRVIMSKTFIDLTDKFAKDISSIDSEEKRNELRAEWKKQTENLKTVSQTIRGSDAINIFEQKQRMNKNIAALNTASGSQNLIMSALSATNGKIDTVGKMKNVIEDLVSVYGKVVPTNSPIYKDKKLYQEVEKIKQIQQVLGKYFNKVKEDTPGEKELGSGSIIALRGGANSLRNRQKENAKTQGKHFVENPKELDKILSAFSTADQLLKAVKNLKLIDPNFPIDEKFFEQNKKEIQEFYNKMLKNKNSYKYEAANAQKAL